MLNHQSQGDESRETEELLWTDPYTGETYAVDRRTGNSYAICSRADNNDRDQGQAKRRTLGSRPFPSVRGLLRDLGEGETGNETPQWIQEALNVSFCLCHYTDDYY